MQEELIEKTRGGLLRINEKARLGEEKIERLVKKKNYQKKRLRQKGGKRGDIQKLPYESGEPQDVGKLEK